MGLRNCGLVVQLVRMPACHAGGRGFEPHPGRHKNANFGKELASKTDKKIIHYAGVAQLV